MWGGSRGICEGGGGDARSVVAAWSVSASVGVSPLGGRSQVLRVMCW